MAKIFGSIRKRQRQQFSRPEDLSVDKIMARYGDVSAKGTDEDKAGFERCRKEVQHEIELVKNQYNKTK